MSTDLLLGKNKRTTTGRKGMREIERLEQENERLYRSQATMAKQIKLLNSKLANSTDNDVIARAFDKLRQLIQKIERLEQGKGKQNDNNNGTERVQER